MSGFVATSLIAEADPQVDTLANDGWFPDLDLRLVRELVRLDGTVTEPRLREAVRTAVASVNRELATFRADNIAAGAVSLAAVDTATVDGEPRLVLLYRRAVASLAKADLAERYRDFDAAVPSRVTDLGPDPLIDAQRRNARWAVREIQGQPHSIVELI